MVKNLLAMQETWARSLCLEDALEKGTVILAWRIPHFTWKGLAFVLGF